jgi:L-ascorbate metabolism protein UlaG (beta-lactamase superfamily)
LTTDIHFLGVATFEAHSPAGRVLFDPFLTGNPVAPVSADDVATPDVILVSHAAFDHMGDAASIALRTGAPVVCGNDTARALEKEGVPADQIRVTVWGIEVEVGGFRVQPVEAHHWSQIQISPGNWVTGTPMGFVVAMEEDCRIYHFGDTAVFSDLRLIGELYRPTVGLLGCTQPWSLVPAGAGRVLTGEMSPESAALAAEFLGIDAAVACHYEDPGHPDVRAFVAAVEKRDAGAGRTKPYALRAGQILRCDKGSYSIEEGES